MNRRSTNSLANLETADSLPNIADDLLSLVEVVDAGGFSAASDRTGIPKSKLSRHVRRLEAALGLPLLQRDSRRFEVTEAGLRMVKRGRNIRDEMRSAVAEANDEAAVPQGRLRVACPVALAILIVGRVAMEFAAAHPLVKPSLSTNSGAIDALAEPFDLVVFPTLKALPDSEMIAYHLTTFEYGLFAAPAFLDRSVKLSSPSDIWSVDVIGWHGFDKTPAWTLTDAGGKQMTVEVRPRASFDNLLLIREAAIQGLGIARLPFAQCRADIEQGRLRVVLPAWRPQPMSIYAMFTSRQHISKAGKLFLEALKAAAKSGMPG